MHGDFLPGTNGRQIGIIVLAINLDLSLDFGSAMLEVGNSAALVEPCSDTNKQLRTNPCRETRLSINGQRKRVNHLNISDVCRSRETGLPT